MSEDEEENGNSMDTGFICSLEPIPEDQISEVLLHHLDSSGRSYMRERRKCCRRIVSEIGSPPRVTEEIRRMHHRHLLPGLALDLTVMDPEDGRPWDFSQADKREKARQMRRRQKPYLLLGSPG